MSSKFEGKVAVVTGGSSGIGRAAALAFGKAGAKVVVSDVDHKGGEETVRMLKKQGGISTFVKVDVTSAVEVEAMINKLIETYGKLDCAFNNAGTVGMSFVPTAECTEENWDRIMNINLKGVWLCMKYEIPQMMKNGGGTIVNTSSMHGLAAAFSSAAYGASKHGVIGLTKTAALEYAKVGIRINAVCPGIIRTAMVIKQFSGKPKLEAQANDGQPMGRMGTPEEIAEAVLWLCSDAASYVTGHAMVVDGGSLAATSLSPERVESLTSRVCKK